MPLFIRAAGALLPRPLRAWVRMRHRGFVLNRAMARFVRNPEAAQDRGDDLISDLVYGWGNEDWSGQGDFLRACLRHAMHCQGPVLECGSGLSTLLVGAVLQRRGLALYSLEHMPQWADRVQRTLDRFGIGAVTLIRSPLKRFGDFDWYDVPHQAMPRDFGLVLCDGPPAVTRGGRYGLLPVMRAHLRAGCAVLLDDAERHAEQEIAQRWVAESGGALLPDAAQGAYLQIRIGATA